MTKQLERFQDWGYQVNHDSKGFLHHRYTDFARWNYIHHDGTGRDPGIPINTFGVKDEYGGILIIARACNDSPGHDPRSRSQKLPLRAQIVSYWTLVEQRPLSELSRIVYANVMEQTLTIIMNGVYETMDAPADKDLLIVQGDPSFDTLLTRTPFGAGVQRMLHEYADLFGDKKIKSFYFRLKGGIDHFDFIIDLT